MFLLRWMSWLCLGLFWFAHVSPSHAYILPARFYLSELAKQRGHFRKLRIKQTTTYFTGSGSVGETVEEILSIQCPGEIRLEQYRQSALVGVEVWSGNTWQRWKKSTEQSTREERKPHPRFDFFAVESSGDGYGNIVSLLNKMYVRYRGARRWSQHSDYAEQLYVGLRLQAGRVAVVLGTRATRSQRNQFWIDKKWRVPVRFVGRLQEKGSLYDIRFLDYILQSGRPAFPGRVEVYENGKLTLRTLIYHVEKVRSFPAQTFSRVR